jgi:hypothetical protein
MLVCQNYEKSEHHQSYFFQKNASSNPTEITLAVVKIKKI